MTRRFEGYVVGRRSVQRQSGWRIARRLRNGERRYYFIPEADVANGIELFPHAEVTFEVEQRDGRWLAKNVRPKTAQQMEDSMRNTNLKSIASIVLAILAILAVVLAVFKPWQHPMIRDYVVETRAEWALNDIRQLTADQLITDEVVRAAVNDRRWGGLRGVSWAAREAVFDEHQCPIFSIGFGNADPSDLIDGTVCRTARYAEGRTDEENWWYNEAGIPTIISPLIAEMRSELYAVGRAYLADPENLHAVYEAKVDVIIDEFSRLSEEDRVEFVELLRDAVASFIQFRDHESLRALYNEYIAQEAAWRADESDSLDPFRVWQDTRLALGINAISLDWYLFAGRRFSEGDNDLLDTYIEIGTDLLTRLDG